MKQFSTASPLPSSSNPPETSMGSFYVVAPGNKVGFVDLGVQLDQIMENFDFKKVHKVMLSLNWVWADNKVPSEEKLIEEARRLLTSVYLEPKDPWIVCCGGFCAEKSEGMLRLYFALEEADMWGIDPSELDDQGQK